jgi:alpha-1,6-mannosyltransferase
VTRVPRTARPDRATPCSTLHLTNAYHPSSGGIRRFYEALLDAAGKLGRRMTLVVPGAVDGLERPSATTAVYTVRSPRSPVFDRRYRLMPPHKYLLRRNGPLRDILRAAKPDVVEVNDKYTLCYLAGVLRKGWWHDVPRPVLVGHSSERMDDGFTQQLSGGPLARAFCRWFIRTVYGPLFDYHVANSAYTAGELTAALPPWRAGHVHVLPMGIDTACFRPGRRDPALRRDLLSRLGADPEAVLLLYAGRLSPEKGVMALVDMLRVLDGRPRDYRLVVIGEGPLRKALERQAAALSRPRLLLWGHVEAPHELARLVASADVFVHPNAREPFGIGPLEAMAAGTRVVVPARGGVLSYASGTTNWLAVPTAAGLAAAVERAASESPDAAAARVEAARARAEQFAWPAVVARWFDLYDTLHEQGSREWSVSGHVDRVPLRAARGPSPATTSLLLVPAAATESRGGGDA